MHVALHDIRIRQQYLGKQLPSWGTVFHPFVLAPAKRFCGASARCAAKVPLVCLCWLFRKEDIVIHEFICSNWNMGGDIGDIYVYIYILLNFQTEFLKRKAWFSTGSQKIQPGVSVRTYLLPGLPLTSQDSELGPFHWEVLLWTSIPLSVWHPGNCDLFFLHPDKLPAMGAGRKL